MYCDIIDNKIVNPSNISGSREFDIDYNYFISCAKDYLIYDENLDKIVINPNFRNSQDKKNILLEIQKYNKELEEIDKKRIRAICEPSIKNEETQETWLDFYNSQVVEIRNKIIELNLEND